MTGMDDLGPRATARRVPDPRVKVRPVKVEWWTNLGKFVQGKSPTVDAALDMFREACLAPPPEMCDQLRAHAARLTTKNPP